MGDHAAESGTRARTRRAILAAAARVLAKDRAATLAHIAKAADVGRSTLHRYFADRDELIGEAVAEAYLVIQRAVEDAAIGDGAPLDAMRRLVEGLVQTGDLLLFLHGDSRVLDGVDVDERAPNPVTQGVHDLIARGQREGVFDPEAGVEWVHDVLWALVYSGCDAASRGVLPRHGVAAAVVRVFEDGVRKR
ncbi:MULTISPECIES: TetR/AcrR family transcriptional regulator [Actinosynnema]|uniref:TetR/AcrR family transcriptional regulator n=1 Tax=Actinosynnema TaxID=40566 RepID=UPI0020A2DB61|nr:TetR/AcrR family transcriptional regulator [Actinosynnema pretiosum]MCP2095595.1 transcriptional regulator, TetR family [Actinosynnema pretiosum]